MGIWHIFANTFFSHNTFQTTEFYLIKSCYYKIQSTDPNKISKVNVTAPRSMVKFTTKCVQCTGSGYRHLPCEIRNGIEAMEIPLSPKFSCRIKSENWDAWPYLRLHLSCSVWPTRYHLTSHLLRSLPGIYSWLWGWTTLAPGCASSSQLSIDEGAQTRIAKASHNPTLAAAHHTLCKIHGIFCILLRQCWYLWMAFHLNLLMLNVFLTMQEGSYCYEAFRWGGVGGERFQWGINFLWKIWYWGNNFWEF